MQKNALHDIPGNVCVIVSISCTRVSVFSSDRVCLSVRPATCLSVCVRVLEHEVVYDCRLMREMLPSMTTQEVIRIHGWGPPKSYLSREHIDREIYARRKVC